MFEFGSSLYALKFLYLVTRFSNTFWVGFVLRQFKFSGMHGFVYVDTLHYKFTHLKSFQNHGTLQICHSNLS